MLSAFYFLLSAFSEYRSGSGHRPVEFASLGLKNMNAKPPEVIAQFIELRAQGCSLARIGAQLNVSKPTLIAWTRKFSHEIYNLEALEGERLTEQYRLALRHRLHDLADDLRRVREELSRPKLESIPTHRLFALASVLRHETGLLTKPLSLSWRTDEMAEVKQLLADPNLTREGLVPSNFTAYPQAQLADQQINTPIQSPPPTP
jgi:hypothetical protein